jgi:ABC-type lipoprotein release transport system permease subunit
VFAISVAALVGAALVASFAPAWRASRISPIRALRYE